MLKLLEAFPGDPLQIGAILGREGSLERPSVRVLGYLTACTLYAALFNRSPEGLPVDTVNDKMRSRDGKPAQDPDGGPLKRTFSAQDRADLQRIAWEGLQQFQQLAASAGPR